jgi:hypothetical protein
VQLQETKAEEDDENNSSPDQRGASGSSTLNQAVVPDQNLQNDLKELFGEKH